VDKKNLAFKRKMFKLDRGINAFKDKIFCEEDPMIKSILILAKNSLVLEKNQIKSKICESPSLKEYFELVNEPDISFNQKVCKKNLEIIKSNSKLKGLLNMTQRYCLKYILDLAKNKEIKEIPYELREYII